MSDDNLKIGPGAAFWVLGVLFLLWNAFGCFLYYMDMTMSDQAYTEAYGQAMTDLRPLTPAWVSGFYAIAVWGGLLASILYLLKKKWAVPLFMLSLVGIVISMSWGLFSADVREAAGGVGAALVMPIIVGGIVVFQVWWSKKQAANGNLG